MAELPPGGPADEDAMAPKTDHTIVPVRIEEALGAAAMALICLISFGNVVARYATNVSFAFTEEYSVFLLVFMTFVGASAAFAGDQHIRITFFLDRLPPRAALALRGDHDARDDADVLADPLLRCASSPIPNGIGRRPRQVSAIPTWIYTIWMPILCIAILLRVLGRGWAVLIRRRSARR